MENSESFGFLFILKELDWSEPWLAGVFLFYLLLGTIIYKFRYENGVQLFLFVMLLMIVYVSEDINEYLANHHKKFTQHQYFDSSGTFISCLMSLPLLFLCACILSNWLILSSRLLSTVAVQQRSKRIKEE